MKPDNIARVGVFLEDDGGVVHRLKGLFPNVSYQFKGTNIYLHIDAAAHARLVADGVVFSSTSNNTVAQLIEDMPDLGEGPFYLNVGLEPTDGYAYCTTDDGKALIAAAAKELAQYRKSAADQGFQLDIVVRYASEMNLGSYSNGDKTASEPYKDTFHKVGAMLKEADTHVKMVFSPAISFQTDDSTLSAFWPGTGHVDIIGGTWYMNGATSGSTIATTIDKMKKYLLHRTVVALPFGIDEIGGWDPALNDNNHYIAEMLEAVGNLGPAVQIDYVTLFHFNGSNPPKHWNTNPDPKYLD